MAIFLPTIITTLDLPTTDGLHTPSEKKGGIEAALFTSLAADLGMLSTLPPNQILGLYGMYC